MKNSIQLFLLVIFCVIQFSCKNDNDSKSDSYSLIGEWLRSDSTENIQYKLVFTENHIGSNILNYGLVINSETFHTGEAISSAREFEWEIVNNLLVITGNDLGSTSIEFISDNEVLLNDYSEFVFNKIGNGENY